MKDWYVDSTTTPGSAADYDWYYDLALYYFSNDSLRFAMNDKWKVTTDPGTGQTTFTDYTSLTAREFRYDTGISRYLCVDYDTNNASMNPSAWSLVASPMLTEYAGSIPLTDSLLMYSTGYSAVTNTRYFLGEGSETLDFSGVVTDSRYLNADVIDSNVLATDNSGAAIVTTAYTAFGQAVPPFGAPSRPALPSTLDTRYQYAGGWGHEAGLIGVDAANVTFAPLTLVYSGTRFYQPDIGRHIQRVSIEEAAGFNPYLDSGDGCPPGVFATKGGKQNIRPSDLPSFWDTLKRGQKIDWLKTAIKSAKSAAHKATLKGFLKVIRRGGGLGGMLLFACAELAIDGASEAINWKPELPDGPTRAGGWRRWLW